MCQVLSTAIVIQGLTATIITLGSAPWGAPESETGVHPALLEGA